MAAASALDEVRERLRAMDPVALAKLIQETSAATPIWVPNPGPQYRALLSEADELFYGGSAGSGKTDLLLGCALTQHEKALIMRRVNKDAKDMADRLLDEILGSRDGWSGQDGVWRGKGKKIEFSGCQDEKDKQRWKGKPHDLKGFDEITDFLESQYRFIIGWNRSATPGQRCRVICTGNPPTAASGLWVIQYWGPWLDPTHPNPAQDGELRWFTTIDGKDVEVDGPGPHKIPGESKPVVARSRTFIRGWLTDNPDLSADGQYEARLSAMPKRLRDAYRDGRFDASLRDDPWQVIPTQWVIDAQRRWTPNRPVGVPMCCLSIDVAQGGNDDNVLSARYDAWFAPFIVVPGVMTPLGGTNVAGIVVSHRHDGCPVVVDCGGGYGGPVYEHLKANGVNVVAYKGSESASTRTGDQKLKFKNKRMEVFWRVREALDPDQIGGSTMCLPPDPELLADLTCLTYEVVTGGVIQMRETKEDLTKRLGRSTNKGDAVAMSWNTGDKMQSAYQLWGIGRGGKRFPTVVNSHMSARRK